MLFYNNWKLPDIALLRLYGFCGLTSIPETTNHLFESDSYIVPSFGFNISNAQVSLD